MVHVVLPHSIIIQLYTINTYASPVCDIMFHLIIPVPARIVFKTKPCIRSSSESTLLLPVLLALPLSLLDSCVSRKATGVCSGLWPSGHL